MSHIVVGTAGHIDHGKTSLVRALTGTDTDTLQEEQERAITINIGFAFWGERVTIIDVPGHERFIKNMVSGVSTIDFVLLVIAADDGIMPQTREHLDIIRLLNIRAGMVVLTKIDMVEPDWLELQQEEIREFLSGTFLENAPLVPVDSISGRGIDRFREVLDAELKRMQPRHRPGMFRELVDRVFSMHGYGTVVTGTVISGSISTGSEIDVLPAGLSTKVRGIQVHGEARQEARLGDRAALNLQGVSADNLTRGDVLIRRGAAAPGYMLDVRLQLLQSADELKDRARVRCHLGTSEVMARVRFLGDRRVLAGGDTIPAQLTLESQVVANHGDRFVIRTYSPQVTIGGGVVLNPHPLQKRRSSRFNGNIWELWESDTLDRVLLGYMQDNPMLTWQLPDFQIRVGRDPADLQQAVDQLLENGDVVKILDRPLTLLLPDMVEDYSRQIRQQLQRFHQQQPQKNGMAGAHLRAALVPELDAQFFEFFLHKLENERILKVNQAIVALENHQVQLDSRLEKAIGQLQQWLHDQGVNFQRSEDVSMAFPDWSPVQQKEIIGYLQQQGRVVWVNNEYLTVSDILSEVRESLVFALNENSAGLTISEIGQILGTPRRITVPLMEYFDNLGLTYREDDKRKLEKEIS